MIHKIYVHIEALKSSGIESLNVGKLDKVN